MLDSSLLYGEISARGLRKVLDHRHLNGDEAKVIYDLGMGLGKAAMQCFLQCRIVERVVGIELCESRFCIAMEAAKQLVHQHSQLFVITEYIENIKIVVKATRLYEILIESDFRISLSDAARLLRNAPLDSYNCGKVERTLEFRRDDLFACPLSELAKVDILIFVTDLSEIGYRL
jgi:hypothetical protein